MKINFAEMSAAELQSVIEEAQKALQARKLADKAVAKRKLAEQAKEFGFSIEELFGAGKRGRAAVETPDTPQIDGRAQVAPKYAHPHDPSLTWTGRGRSPKWVIELEAQGVSRDEMVIDRG